ncbi:MAG TPA: acetyl-CoA C-acyltransferase FadI [Polyangiaceae bacterium]|jgi:acetyl-CoA acyltransferase|nr:acetyl-CoA C-acyltransferase FadI [Polyangiaceae bacterium]
MAKSNGDRRVAIVAGLRTPFAKQGSAYRQLSALELGKIVVAELLQRTGLEPAVVQQVVYGQVIPSLTVPNIAREIVLGTGMPRSIEAYSVARACATSYQSAVNVAESIQAGVIDCGIAGGADSASDVPMAVSKRLSEALVKASKARSFADKLRAFASLGVSDLVPVPPALKELSTGLTMGESAEKMAKENGISRADQDAFAHRSHTLAAQAWADGRLREEVMPVFVPPGYEAFDEDNLVRKDSELDAYAKLKPVFDRRYGTVTAGNSSPLTDGASALLLMSEKKAKALGFEVLGFLRSYAFAAVDPAEQLLMGPAYAAPLALDRSELKLKNMDLIDMHEAFSAQVLSNIQALESDLFAQQKLGRDKRVGKIDWDKLNVSGGSIALGHPFAATGARQISQVLRELRRRGGQYALCTACAAGGLGAAMVLEAA